MQSSKEQHLKKKIYKPLPPHSNMNICFFMSRLNGRSRSLLPHPWWADYTVPVQLFHLSLRFKTLFVHHDYFVSYSNWLRMSLHSPLLCSCLWEHFDCYQHFYLHSCQRSCVWRGVSVPHSDGSRSVGNALIAHQRHWWLRNLFLDSLKQTTGAEIQ